MPYGHINQLEAIAITNPLANQALMKVLVGPEQGWDGYVLRVFTIAAGGYTPKHQHPWPHINYILSGEGTLLIEGVEQIAQAGNYAYIPGNTLHQFKAAEDHALQFICIVPKEGHIY